MGLSNFLRNTRILISRTFRNLEPKAFFLHSVKHCKIPPPPPPLPYPLPFLEFFNDLSSQSPFLLKVQGIEIPLCRFGVGIGCNGCCNKIARIRKIHHIKLSLAVWIRSKFMFVCVCCSFAEVCDLLKILQATLINHNKVEFSSANQVQKRKLITVNWFPDFSRTCRRLKASARALIGSLQYLGEF